MHWADEVGRVGRGWNECQVPTSLSSQAAACTRAILADERLCNSRCFFTAAQETFCPPLHLVLCPLAMQLAAARIRCPVQYVVTCSFVLHFFSQFFSLSSKIHPNIWGTNEPQQFDEGPEQVIGFMIHELQNAGHCQSWLLFVPAKPSLQCQIVEKNNGGRWL